MKDNVSGDSEKRSSASPAEEMMAVQQATATAYQRIVRYAREELGLRLEDWQHRVLAAVFGAHGPSPAAPAPAPALLGLEDCGEVEQ